MVRVTDGDTQAVGVVVNVLVRLRVDVNEFETEAELVYVALVVPSEVCAISKTRLARSRMACSAVRGIGCSWRHLYSKNSVRSSAKQYNY